MWRVRSRRRPVYTWTKRCLRTTNNTASKSAEVHSLSAREWPWQPGRSVWMINKLFWSLKTDHDPLIMQDLVFVFLLCFFYFSRHFGVLSKKVFIPQVANFTHFWTYRTIFHMQDKSYFRFCYFMTAQWSWDFKSDISHNHLERLHLNIFALSHCSQ